MYECLSWTILNWRREDKRGPETLYSHPLCKEAKTEQKILSRKKKVRNDTPEKNVEIKDEREDFNQAELTNY